MLPYFALLFIPGFLQIWMKSGHIKLKSLSSVISGEDIALPTFFFLFLTLLAARDKTVGRDLKTYEYLFITYGQAPFSYVFYRLQEWIFRLYCWVCYNCVSHNYHVFLALTAILSVVPIAYVYNQDKRFGYLKIAVFVNMSTFIMYFSGVRQGLAMSIGLLAYQALKEKRLWRYFVWSAIAFFIHHSGFMILFMLPLYRMRFKKNDLLWIIPGIITVFVFNRQIFNLLSAFAGKFSENYGSNSESTGAFGSFMLFALFAIFCYVIADERQMDEEAFALRNILSFAVVLQSFAQAYDTAMRMNYYFILLIPLALGKSLEYARPRYAQAAKAGKMLICVFFTAYFLYGTYRSYVTGISSLDTIPYIPFWKG